MVFLTEIGKILGNKRRGILNWKPIGQADARLKIILNKHWVFASKNDYQCPGFVNFVIVPQVIDKFYKTSKLTLYMN